jgi:hypothetical protein
MIALNAMPSWKEREKSVTGTYARKQSDIRHRTGIKTDRKGELTVRTSRYPKKYCALTIWCTHALNRAITVLCRTGTTSNNMDTYTRTHIHAHCLLLRPQEQPVFTRHLLKLQPERQFMHSHAWKQCDENHHLSQLSFLRAHDRTHSPSYLNVLHGPPQDEHPHETQDQFQVAVCNILQSRRRRSRASAG